VIADAIPVHTERPQRGARFSWRTARRYLIMAAIEITMIIERAPEFFGLKSTPLAAVR
jgi:hypothetical protein